MQIAPEMGKKSYFVRFNLYPDTNAHHRHRSDLQHGSLLVHQPGPPVAAKFPGLRNPAYRRRQQGLLGRNLRPLCQGTLPDPGRPQTQRRIEHGPQRGYRTRPGRIPDLLRSRRLGRCRLPATIRRSRHGRTYAARDRHPATPGRQIGPAADSACHGRTGPSLHGSHRRPAAARHAGIHRQ